MGDYTKLIVNCRIKNGISKDEIIKELDGIYSSAYHCGGELVELDEDGNLVIVNQHKYSRGIDEFLEWLRPNILQGFGDNENYAIVCTEFSKPKIHYLVEDEE